MTLARIYVPSKTPMQSGRAQTLTWLLEYEPVTPRRTRRPRTRQCLARHRQQPAVLGGQQAQEDFWRYPDPGFFGDGWSFAARCGEQALLHLLRQAGLHARSYRPARQRRHCSTDCRAAGRTTASCMSTSIMAVAAARRGCAMQW